MRYEFTEIEQNEIPKMKVPYLQHALETYASERRNHLRTISCRLIEH